MITGTAKVNALGDFLRARRDQVRPEAVGLVPGARRRAPGLRREELAMLAGISVEYYLRLERGRAHNPSPQILEALARALRLDGNATQHLRDLAGPTGPGYLRLGSRSSRLSRSNRSVLDAGHRGQQIPRCLGGKSNCPSAVTRVHTGTKLPALAPIRPPLPGSSTSIGTRRPLAPSVGCGTSPVPVQKIRACAH